jgi:hypothetical protein
MLSDLRQNQVHNCNFNNWQRPNDHGLVGPAPFIIALVPFTSLVQGTVTFFGTGFAMIMVKAFGRSHAAANRNGYNDDQDTDMFISSVKTFFE